MIEWLMVGWMGRKGRKRKERNVKGRVQQGRATEGLDVQSSFSLTTNDDYISNKCILCTLISLMGHRKEKNILQLIMPAPPNLRYKAHNYHDSILCRNTHCTFCLCVVLGHDHGHGPGLPHHKIFLLLLSKRSGFSNALTLTRKGEAKQRPPFSFCLPFPSSFSLHLRFAKLFARAW